MSSHIRVHLELQNGSAIGLLATSARAGVAVQRRYIYNLAPQTISQVASLPDGHYALDTDPNRGVGHGALDYVRTPSLQPRFGCMPGGADPLVRALVVTVLGPNEAHGWVAGDLLESLERELVASRRVFLFGELISQDAVTEVHNIHMNQGSPSGSVNDRYASENGTWQDGAVIIQTKDEQLVACLTKFSSQAIKTDDSSGAPL